jgi:COMPASS component SPP1
LTPEGDKAANTNSSATDIAAELAKISSAKEEARFRHTLLKVRVKFVGTVKSAVPSHAAAQDIKVKEFCGYDRRLEWSEQEFWSWWEQQEGNNTKPNHGDTTLPNGQASATALTLSPPADAENEDEDSPLICPRKRCLRHTDWPKLALDALRAEISENSDRMRGLEGEERKAREQALLRSVGGRKGKGWVERHEEDPIARLTATEGVDGDVIVPVGDSSEVKDEVGITAAQGKDDVGGESGDVEMGGVVEKGLAASSSALDVSAGEGEGMMSSASQSMVDGGPDESTAVSATQQRPDAKMVEAV